jgi:hypothetical protein
MPARRVRTSEPMSQTDIADTGDTMSPAPSTMAVGTSAATATRPSSSSATVKSITRIGAPAG